MTRIVPSQNERARAASILAGTLCAVFGTFAVAAGDPAVAPATAASPAVPTAPASSLATPVSQEALLDREARHPEQLFVLDVRTPEEFAAGHVPGAVNVPYDQLASRLAEVPKDKDV